MWLMPVCNLQSPEHYNDRRVQAHMASEGNVTGIMKKLASMKDTKTWVKFKTLWGQMVDDGTLKSKIGSGGSLSDEDKQLHISDLLGFAALSVKPHRRGSKQPIKESLQIIIWDLRMALTTCLTNSVFVFVNVTFLREHSWRTTDCPSRG